MANFFRAMALLITLSMVSYAFAQQTPPQSMTLQQFQQWMQQQDSPKETTPQSTAQQEQPGTPSMAGGQSLPPNATVLPPPGTSPTASGVPGQAVRAVPVRSESIQFNSDTEKRTPTSANVRRTSRALYKPLTYEQSRRIMLRSVPSSLAPPIPDSKYVFDSMLQQNMPLTPQQVVKLRQQIDISQRAAATPALIPPKPVSTTLMINLAPGTTPPAVRLAVGYVSSLVFVDSTGAPWPIAAFDIGNPGAVTIQWDQKSNIILMQALAPYSYGDIVIRLVGLPTPITLELVSGQRVVDYRVDIHVPGIGPNTKELPVGSTLPSPASNLLLNVLDGVAPPGSRALLVRGADCQAWLLGDRIYLRSRLTVLSPGWVGKMVSPDGMNAYELPRTSSVLISRYGEPAELKIEGF